MTMKLSVFSVSLNVRDQQGGETASFTDVRELQRALKQAGITVISEVVSSFALSRIRQATDLFRCSDDWSQGPVRISILQNLIAGE